MYVTLAAFSGETTRRLGAVAEEQSQMQRRSRTNAAATIVTATCAPELGTDSERCDITEDVSCDSLGGPRNGQL